VSEIVNMPGQKKFATTSVGILMRLVSLPAPSALTVNSFFLLQVSEAKFGDEGMG
jgi:hypothetical protein